MTIQEIADRLVTLYRQGQYEQAVEELYANDAVTKDSRGKVNLFKKGKIFSEMTRNRGF